MALQFSSVCLRCDATDCTDDACTGYGEAAIGASDDVDADVGVKLCGGRGSQHLVGGRRMNISKFTFVSGAGDGGQTACLMSARSLLDGRTFGDGHPSGVLRRLGIAINDGGWWASDEERTAVLMPIALDERLCAETCDASSAAEQQRARLCAEWALSFAAPLALDCAADAMRARWPDDAATMSDCARKLRLCPTRENALAAAAAYACADAASATAANAAAAYANAAVAAVAAIAAAAYANAAVAAVAAIAAAAAYGTKKIEIRNSIIALFMRLLDVRAECAA